MRIHTHLHFGRLQSHVRLMPDALVLRSKIDSDNRFLPHYDVPEYAAYQPHAYGFIPYPAACQPGAGANIELYVNVIIHVNVIGYVIVIIYVILSECEESQDILKKRPEVI